LSGAKVSLIQLLMVYSLGAAAGAKMIFNKQ
jgi:hypothetical protein